MMNLKKYNLDQLIDAVGDGEDLQRMLTIFIESTPKILNGINYSYIENDLDDLAGHAHKLKATIDMLKISELQDLIRKIDRVSSILENQYELPHMINKVNNIMHQVMSEIQRTYLLESKV